MDIYQGVKGWFEYDELKWKIICGVPGGNPKASAVGEAPSGLDIAIYLDSY